MFHVLSMVKRIKVSWLLSVRKTVARRNLETAWHSLGGFYSKISDTHTCTHTHTHTHTSVSVYFSGSHSLSLSLYILYIYKDGWCRSKERIRIYFKIRSTMRFVFFEFIYFVLTYVLYIRMFQACCFRQRTYVALGLLNEVLNETWTHCCFQYKWTLVGQTGLYRELCSSFLECVYFGLLYPSLIFYMFIVVCVYVCELVLEWFWVSQTFFWVSWGVLWF